MLTEEMALVTVASTEQEKTIHDRVVEAYEKITSTVVEVENEIEYNILDKTLNDNEEFTSRCLAHYSKMECLNVYGRGVLAELADESCFPHGDLKDWEAPKAQPHWSMVTPEWQAWLPMMEHFFGDQWKELGIYQPSSFLRSR